MREILFRGKEVESSDWYYGDIFHSSMNVDTTRIHDYINRANVEIIPDTLGQYTGLTDKNGTKIFEGDIVRYGDSIHKVVFEQRNGTAYFGVFWSPKETVPFGKYQDLRHIEVIGNIYDNPELIGGSENAE